MIRIDKIEILFSEIQEKMALLSLLMGNKSEWIDESYVEEKEKLGNKLIQHLDMENKARFFRLYNPLQKEYIEYERRLE